jgi:hypothetical protein
MYWLQLSKYQDSTRGEKKWKLEQNPRKANLATWQRRKVLLCVLALVVAQGAYYESLPEKEIPSS